MLRRYQEHVQERREATYASLQILEGRLVNFPRARYLFHATLWKTQRSSYSIDDTL